MVGTLSLVAAFVATLPVLLNAAAYAGRRRVLAGHEPPRASRVPATPLPAYLHECAATALAIGFRPSRYGPRSARPDAPVAILLPGAAQSAGSFLLLRRRLRAIGWDSIAGVRRTRPDRLEDTVRELDARVRSLSAQHQSLTLIGHGSGGLVGRTYLLGRPDPRVRQLITLGTPHQGTLAPITRIGCCRALAPGSELLNCLAADAGLLPPPERIAIYSELDAWTFPVEAAYLPGAFNIQVRGVGHFSLLTSRRVFEILAENLIREPSQDERA